MADPRSLLPVMVVGFAAAAVVGYAVSSLQPTTYQARVTLTESATQQRLTSDAQAEFASRQRMAQYEKIASSRLILEAVSDRLGLGDPTSLSEHVDARTVDDGAILEVTATDGEPNRATAIANAVAIELTSSVRQLGDIGSTLTEKVDAELASRLERYEDIEATVDRLLAKSEPTREQRARLRRLEAGLGELANSYARLVPYSGQVLPNQLAVIGPAVTPREPVTPRPAVDAFLAGCLGALIVTPLALVPHFLDYVVRDRDDVRDETELAALAVVPRVPGDRLRPTLARRPMLLAPSSVAAEAYRTLRWVCDSARGGSYPATILMVGPRKSDATSMVAANVALAFAQSGRGVALVDADIDSPRTHDILREPNSPGLAEALAWDPAGVSSMLRTTSHPGLHLLSAGDGAAQGVQHVGSPKMRALLTQLKASHDVVIIDCPPIDRSSAALSLGPMVDQLVLVLDATHTRRAEARAAAAVVAQSPAHVLGAVLVSRPSRLVGTLANLLPPIRSNTGQRPAVDQAPTAPQR